MLKKIINNNKSYLQNGGKFIIPIQELKLLKKKFMKKIKAKINFKDKRGVISDLIEKEKINAITYISFFKNKVRANHYHKKTIQWNYVLSGKVLFVSKINGKIKKYLVKKKILLKLKPENTTQ